ncbi:ASCH domain-containing protein [Acetobacterium sp.]|uniref:ASCH domain-containing protein n=1 Tax=Acetobacterium sp. TaxID=1872094 RepID=UPI00271F8D30|nr:ASCH domain-containing protein [Acetobacterium sp.]MDO9491990.1 ASCH domain-containing protein [Acetobacterium sp.]
MRSKEKVLLPIRPEYAQGIIDGKKHYEYRKKIFKKPVNTIVMYVTKPVGLIIGEFTIKRIMVDTPESIWLETEAEAGIKKKDFDAYFKGHDKAYAIELLDVMAYHTPINPFLVWNHFVPPQSFRYI